MEQTLGRRERKKQQTRQQIAAAALQLFLEQGFDQVTVAEVAEVADVSTNTVYNYFPTKEELFFGLHQPMEAHLAELLRQREPGEALISFVRRYLLSTLERLYTTTAEQDAARRRVIQVVQASPSLQAHSLQMTQSIEHEVAQALVGEMGAQADEIVPHLVAHLILTLHTKLFAEYDRRRLQGQSSAEIQAALSAMVNAGLALLEHGLNASPSSA
ncbi:TetR family transcriptional regulator [Ktedonosporobacter rubrisoli]|nr:TetR family transcriptional regulator [Ktedonosporobacter rubrisoli]